MNFLFDANKSYQPNTNVNKSHLEIFHNTSSKNTPALSNLRQNRITLPNIYWHILFEVENGIKLQHTKYSLVPFRELQIMKFLNDKTYFHDLH